jgi:hypothetical protein
MNIFVGNLAFSATEEDVKKLFEKFGGVVSVFIVKEKKGVKSRGFGFAEMSDEKQGDEAIAALNGMDFMGRPLNVSRERPKTDLAPKPVKEKELPRKIEAVSQEYHGQKDFGKDKWYGPVFRKVGGEKRRGKRSFDRQEDRSPERPGHSKPWQKSEGEAKPWRKPEGGARPWRKPEGGHRPWGKPEGRSKPWQKTGDRGRPWRKNADESKPAKRFGEHPKPWQRAGERSKPWQKPEGEAKPWRKPEGGARPWRKPEGEAKPWRKPEGGAKPWRKPRESVDSARRSRQRPSAYKR